MTKKTNMQIGYARVSTKDQNLCLQHEALTEAGCHKVYEDRTSGSKATRSGLNTAQEVLRQGDTLVVWKLDRLGRNVKNLVTMIGELENRGIHFKSLTDNIDTSTPAGRFFFHIMASLSEMERELMIERTHAGLESARKRGRIGGRKRSMTPSKMESAKRLLSDGIPPKDVAQDLGISVPTLYRWLPASERTLSSKA